MKKMLLLLTLLTTLIFAETITFKKGWNFVGFNNTITPSTDTTFNNKDNIYVIWKYTNNSLMPQNGWSGYAPETGMIQVGGATYPEITSILPSDGAWIYARKDFTYTLPTTSTTLTSLPINGGWNLLSALDNNTIDPTSFTDTQIIWTYRAGAWLKKSFVDNDYTAHSLLTTINTHEAFWLYSTLEQDETQSGGTTTTTTTALVNPIVYVPTGSLSGSINSGGLGRILARTTATSRSLWLSSNSAASTIPNMPNAAKDGSLRAPFVTRKIDIDSLGKYSISNLPSGAYSLSYADPTGTNKGVKFDDIVIPPGQGVVKDVDETDVKVLGSVSMNIASLTGSNLSGAEIRINDLNITELSDSNGSLEFTGLPEGSYSITITNDNYVPKYMTFNVTSSQNTDLQTIELNSKKGSISGNVIVSGAQTYSNVMIYAKADDGSLYATITDEAGSYSIPSVPVGDNYSVIASGHDVKTIKADGLSISYGSTTAVPTLTLIEHEKASDDVKYGTIEGYVRYNDVTTLAHEGIIISVEGTSLEAITARDGSYIINNVPDGNYTLNFTESRYLTHTQNITVVEATSTFLDNVDLQRAVGSVIVKVTDGTINVANVNVKIDNGVNFTTDASGIATLTNLPIGEQTVTASKDGYATATQIVTINSGVEVDKSGTPIVIVKQVLLGSISKGEGVTDHSGVSVNIVGEGLYATTAVDGTFSINAIPSHDIVLEYSADGFKTKVLLYNVEEKGFTVSIQTMESAKISDATVVINSDAMHTNNRVVNLATDAVSAYKMMVSESVAFVNAQLLDYVSSYDYTIAGTGDGTKTIYVKFYDAAVSEATSKIVSDTIILDTTKPVISMINFQTGTNETNTQNIKISFVAIEENSLKFIKVYDDSGVATTLPYSDSGIDWILPTASNQTLKVKVVDIAGNESNEFLQSIIYDTTAPVLSSVLVAGKSIVKDIVTLSVTSTEIYNKVEVSEYSDFRLFSTYAKDEVVEFTVSGTDGDKTLYVRIKDNAGNNSAVETVNVTLDTIKPTKPAITIINAFTNTQSYDMSLSSSSTDTNLAYYQTKLNSGDWQTVTNSTLQIIFNYSLVSDSLNTLQIRAVDDAGNISDISYAYITHDQNALISSSSPSGGIYNSDTIVTLSAVQADKIYYTTNGSNPDTSSAVFNVNTPIVFSTEGTHVLKFFSVDTHENQEVFKTQSYTIDKTAPVIAFANYPTSSNSNVDINITATDSSGVAIRYEITNDGSEPATPDTSSAIAYGSITVSLEGTNVRIKAIGIDEAGNSSNSISATLRVDKTSPTVTATIDTDGPYPVQNGKIITLSAGDSQDQAPIIYYTLDGTTPTTSSTLYSSEFNLTTVGTYDLRAIAIDDLGNMSGINSKTYRMSTIYDSSNNQITTNTTWTKTMSPYSITTDVTIKSGAVLTIEAGVEVVMSNYANLIIQDATVKAQGTSSDTIKFIGENRYGTGGVYFYGDSIDATFNGEDYQDGSILEYIDFSGLYDHAIYATESSPYIKDIKIDGANYGLYLDRSDSKIKNIDINNTKQDAIYVYNTSDVVVENATIKNYGSNAIESYYTDAKITLTSSDITYVDTKTMFYTRSGGSITATQNYFHTYSLSFIGSLIDGDNIVYEPMLSGPIATADFDTDGILDIDDIDDDGDNYTDADEANAHTSQFLATGDGLPADFDSDNISDATDTDDDGDGFLDADEIAVGANPKDANSVFEVVNYALIEGDKTLPVDASIDTLLIKNDIQIPTGVTLTIRAGTKIIMGGNYSWKVYGKIEFLGEQSNRITITPKLPSGDWSNNHYDGFVFYNTSTPLVVDENNNYVSGSIIKYTDIKYAGAVVATIYKTETQKTDGFAYLDNVHIDNSKFDSLHLLNVNTFVLKDSNITNTGSNYDHQAFYVENSNINILNSSISNSAGEDIEIYDSNIDIDNSNFSDNSNYSTVWAKDTVINSSNNSFINSRTAFYLSNDNIFTSTNDTMDEMTPNSYGVIRITSGSKATITNLNIKKSSAYGIYSDTNKKVEIIDSNISNSTNDGFYGASNSISIIKGSKFENNGNEGIHIYYGYYSKIEDCNITSNDGYGIKIEYFASTGESTILQNNITYNNKYGIWTNVSPLISFNSVINNGAGVQGADEGGIHLYGSNANPDIRYNNIYSNSTSASEDNGHYDIKNEKTDILNLFNNYHGSLSLNDMLRSNKASTGTIHFNSFLDRAIDIVNKTSNDFDSDGVVDIYDNDDDNDGILDIIETDIDNTNLSPFADNSSDTVNDTDVDRDGTPNSSDSDDDGDGISDIDEVSLGTNSLLADTDADGVDDGTEQTIGSDPTVKDILSGKLSSDTQISVDSVAYNLEILEGVRLYSSNNSKLKLTAYVNVYGGIIEGLDIDANNINNPFHIYGDTSFINSSISNAVNYCIYLYAKVKLNTDRLTLKDSEYGIYGYYEYSTLTVKDSVFQNIKYRGINISSDYIDLNITGSDFNSINDYAIYNSSKESLFTIKNNIFRNNHIAIFDDEYNDNEDSKADSEISYNTFESNKYSIYEADKNITIQNNLFVNNSSVYYLSQVLGTKTSNLEVKDRSAFKSYIHGQTTATATDDSTNTTITDSELTLTVNDLAGSYIQPDITLETKYQVLSNTADTITFSGTIATSSKTTGTLYTLYDFRPTGAALTASSTGGVVGAFSSIDNDPEFGYETYTDTNTTHGDINSNELWNNDFTITDTLNIYAKVRMARGLNIDMNSTAVEYIYLNKHYNFIMTDTNTNRTTFKSTGINYWGYLSSSYSQDFKNLIIKNSNDHAIYSTGSYTKVSVENSIIEDADERAIYVSFSDSSLIVKDTRFLNIDTKGIYLSGTNTDVTITGCEFNDIGEEAIQNDTSNGTFIVKNNLFRNSIYAINDNHDSYGNYINSTDSEISYNTFDSNQYAIYKADENVAIKENLFVNNPSVYYSTYVLGTKTSNLEVKDRSAFKSYIHGQTTATATDDSTNTTITDSELTLTVNDLAGSYIQPDITLETKYQVLSNTADTITFSGTIATSSKTTGTLYTLYDFRPTGAALTASSTGGVVGAFSSIDNDPEFGYETYTDTNTTAGDINSNELWNNDFTITDTLNIYAKVRMARGLNIDMNSTAVEYIYLNKHYNFIMTDTNTNRTTFKSTGINYWGYLSSSYSQDFKNLIIKNSNDHAIYSTGSYTKVSVENSIIEDADERAIYVSFSDSSLIVKDTRFLNIDTKGIYLSGTNTDVTITGCEFNDIGEEAIQNDTSNGTFIVKNNLFRNSIYAINDNHDSYGNYINSTDSEISYNTFDSNQYAIYKADENVAIKENLFVNNPSVYYSTYVLGTKTSNLEVKDRSAFKSYIHGQTTATATDDSTNTTITDSELTLTVNDLAGSYIQPDITLETKYQVLSNTADTITFSGTIATSSKTTGTLYTLYDFRPTGAALTASSTGGVVGAFSSIDNDPEFGYETYTDTNTTHGDINSNELWNNDFTITDTLNVYAKVRMARGLNIDINSTSNETINLNKNYNFIMTDTDTNRTTFKSVSSYYWYFQSAYSQIYKNLILEDSYYHNIYATGAYTKTNIENSIIRDADDKAIYASFSDSSLIVKDTRFLNIDTKGIYLSGTNTDVTITGCEFNDIGEESIQNDTSNGTFIVKNNLFRNSIYAINDNHDSYGNYINSTDSEISYNTFDSNQYAIYKADENIAIKNNLYTNSTNIYYSTYVLGTKLNDYLSSDNPYVNKYIDDLNIIDTHTANTYASDGGEVGIYGGDGASFSWLGEGLTDSITALANRTTLGTLVNNEYWDGTTTVDGDLTIPKGKILKIKEGSIIKVNGGKITVVGEIFSEGVSGNEIVFTTTADGNESAGQWVGIEFYGIGSSFNNAVVKYAQTAIKLYKDGSNYAKAYTIADVTIISPSVYGIEAGEDTIVEDCTIFGGTHGIYSRKSSTIRRSVITNTSSSAIYIEDGFANINHNLIIDNSGKGIEMSSGASDDYPSITYNTISNTTNEALYYYYVSGDTKYNILENNGYAFYRYSSTEYMKDISVNAMYNSTTADYGNGISVNPKARYADLNTTDPLFSNKTNIAVNDIKNGGHSGIYGVLDLVNFKPTEAVYLTYSPISASIGAYNIIEKIETNSTTFGTPVRDYSELFYKDGQSLSVDLYSSLPNMTATADISDLDSETNIVTVVSDSTNSYINKFDFTIDQSNTKADGNYTVTVHMENSDSSIDNNITTGTFTLDNTATTITLSDFSNGSAISSNTIVHFDIDDNSGVGARRIEYSTDGAVSWISGDKHIELESYGGSVNVGSIKIDGIQYVTTETDGFHLIEINSTNFAKIANSKQFFEASTAGNTAFTTYLKDLDDGVLIAFVARKDGYYSNGYNDLKQALGDVGFEGDFDDYDSVAFIGYKGSKKSLSITKIVANASLDDSNNASAKIDLTNEYGIYNNAITLDTSCYNDDGGGNCSVKARGIDLLGNTGAVFDINYTVSQ